MIGKEALPHGNFAQALEEVSEHLERLGTVREGCELLFEPR